MNFITRNQQEKEELPETYAKYPHLIPFLQKVQKESIKHLYPFKAIDYFTRTQNDLTKKNYQQIINRTVRLIHYILSRSYNILSKSSKAGINYLIFTDTRMGGISMDFSSAATNTFLAKYSISTKHRLDLDMILNHIHYEEAVVHTILSYCNSIVEYAKKHYITNDFVFFDDNTYSYCKVDLDEVDESNYKQVVVFLENYWAKVPTKTGIDILDKVKMYSSKVYITKIDYIKE